MDRTETFQRLGRHYYKSINSFLFLLVSCLIVVAVVIALIYHFESYLNNNAKTKNERVQTERVRILSESHVPSYKISIIQN